MSALYQFSIGTFGIFSRTWLLWQCNACVSCWRHTHTSTTAVMSSRSLCPSWPTDIQRLIPFYSVCVLCLFMCVQHVHVQCVCVNIQRSLMVFCTTMVVCVVSAYVRPTCVCVSVCRHPKFNSGFLHHNLCVCGGGRGGILFHVIMFGVVCFFLVIF